MEAKVLSDISLHRNRGTANLSHSLICHVAKLRGGQPVQGMRTGADPVELRNTDESADVLWLVRHSLATPAADISHG